MSLVQEVESGGSVVEPPALKAVERRVIPIRASSLSTLFDCPKRWAAIHLDGKYMPSSPQARFGTSVHAALAVVDLRHSCGVRDELMDEAMSEFDKEMSKAEDGFGWGDGELAKYGQIGKLLMENYVRDWAGKRSYVGVEMKCSPVTVDVEGVRLKLTGTVDRVRRDDNGGIGITDFKTGATAVGADGSVNVTGHKAQIGVYEVLAANELGVSVTEPGEIIGMQTNGKARIGSGRIEGAALSLVGDEDNPDSLTMAARLLKSGAFFGNSKSMLCSAKFCPVHGGCSYR